MQRSTIKGLSLLLVMALATTFCSTGQSVVDEIKTKVSTNLVQAQVLFLASDELGGRDTGTPEQLIAARYIAAQMQSWGIGPHPKLNSYMQGVPLELFTPPPTVTIAENEVISSADILVWEGRNGATEGNLLMMGFGLETDYETKSAAGKIVVVRGGTSERPSSTPQDIQRKLSLAKENGAIAVIELVTFAAPQWSYYSSYLSKPQVRQQKQDSASVPYLWWNDPNQQVISRLNAAEGSSRKITIAGIKREALASNNVVGYLEGTDPELKNEVVVLSAHYDHIGIGKPNGMGDSIFNGARDNAVGVVAVLSAARALSERPAARSYLFLFFTGEEKGMLGSKYFVENPPVPLRQIVFNLNNDNAGYNDKTIATVVGLNRTNVKHLFEQGCEAFGLKAVEDPAPEQNLFDRSDNVQFAAKGIPAPTFSLGFTGFDAEIGKYYHQASDNPDTLDYAYLTNFFRSFAYTAHLIGNMNQRPFWVEGDKYIEIGKSLYAQETPEKGN